MGGLKLNRDFNGGVMADRTSTGVYRIATDSGNADVAYPVPNWTISGAGSVATSATGSTVTVTGSGAPSPKDGGQIFDDFIAPQSGSSATTPFFAKSNTSSTATSTNGHPGEISFTGGSSSYVATNPSFQIQSMSWEFECLVQVDSVPSADYTFAAGFANNTTPGSITHGVYFYLDSTSPNWQLYCKDAVGVGVTNTASSRAVSTNTYYRLGFVINSASSSVEFFINGSSAGTIATNLPQFSPDNANRLRVLLSYRAPGGGAGKADYCYYKWTMNSSR